LLRDCLQNCASSRVFQVYVKMFASRLGLTLVQAEGRDLLK
jgi:hypothetical protein